MYAWGFPHQFFDFRIPSSGTLFDDPDNRSVSRFFRRLRGTESDNVCSADERRILFYQCRRVGFRLIWAVSIHSGDEPPMPTPCVRLSSVLSSVFGKLPDSPTVPLNLHPKGEMLCPTSVLIQEIGSTCSKTFLSLFPRSNSKRENLNKFCLWRKRTRCFFSPSFRLLIAERAERERNIEYLIQVFEGNPVRK